MLSPEDNFYMQQQQGDEGEGSWKPPPHMQRNDGVGMPGGPPHASKLNTWANKRNKNHGGNMFPNSGPPPNFNGTDKTGWQDGNRHTPSDQNKVPWSDPLQDQLFDSFCDDVFGMNLGGHGGPNPKMGPPPGNGTPHQWGRGEVNQSTPWDIESARGASFNLEGLPGSTPRFMQPVSMDNGTGQWRSWEHEGGGFQKDFHHGGAFPPHMAGPGGKMPNNFYNGANNFIMQQGFNDRMMRNGPPHMQPNTNQQPGGWMDNKYGGNAGRFQAYGAPPQAAPLHQMPPSMVAQRGAFMPPPPLGAAHPPHPGMQPPPPPMHQMPPNPHMGSGPVGGPGHQPGGNAGGQFSVGTFSSATAGMVNLGSFQPNAPTAPPINDDSVWHDPNGDLRKWQRDTGTAAWGDPSKQSGQPIRRWQQTDENDPLSGNPLMNPNSSQSIHMPQQQSPDLAKGTGGQDEEEKPETGWGDLPPLNGGPISHTSPPGPPLGSNNAWMMGSQQPQPLSAQNHNPLPPAAWSDPQRSISSTNMPPTSNLYSNPNGAPGSGTPTDWTRMNFGFNSGAPQPIGGSFEGVPNGGGPSQAAIAAGIEASVATNEMAEKLRMAASKGWIDPTVFCCNNRVSPQTANLLNTLVNRFTILEENNAKIEQLKRQEASGSTSANGSPQRAELDRLIRETNQMNGELAQLREKIHTSAVEAQRAPLPKGMSLADELSNMNSMPIGDVGQLW